MLYNSMRSCQGRCAAERCRRAFFEEDASGDVESLCLSFATGGLHTCAMMECGTGSGSGGTNDMSEEASYGYT